MKVPTPTPAAVLLTVLLLVAAFPAGPATAAEGRARGGMALNDIDDLQRVGAPPDLGLFWVGTWNDGKWTSVESQLRKARDEGVTPVIQWYYWGDDISPECVQNGCWSDLHKSWKSRYRWFNMAETLAKTIHSTMGDREVIVVLETEFNKHGVATWESFDGYLVDQARVFRTHAPNAELVLGFGSWGWSDFKNFDRAIAATDMLGFHDLLGSTRDTDAEMLSSVDRLVKVSAYLNSNFRKPTFLTHWGISSYPEPKYLEYQERLVTEFFKRLPELEANGMEGFIYRSLRDNPNFHTGNYYGVAERHWGFIRADGSWKPAMHDWITGMKALHASAPSTGTTGSGQLEAENMPVKTVGARMSDTKASGGAAWNVWSNGYVAESFHVASSGTYKINVKAKGTEAAGTSPLMVVSVDGRESGRFYVNARTSYWDYGSDVWLSAGTHEVRVAFANNYRTSTEDRNLHVDLVQVPGGSTATVGATSGAIEGESASVRTTGGRSGDSSASGGASWNVWANGYVSDKITVSQSGNVEFNVKAKGTAAAGTSPLMLLIVDGREVGRYYVNARTSYWDYGKTVWLGAGEHDVRVAFVNDHRTSSEDRNLYVDVVNWRVQ